MLWPGEFFPGGHLLEALHAAVIGVNCYINGANVATRRNRVVPCKFSVKR